MSKEESFLRDCPFSDEIRKIRARYSRILEHSFEEIYLFADSNLFFTEVSKGTLKNLGYTMDEMKSLSPVDIKPLVSATDFNTMIQPLRDGEVDILKFSTIHERKDGSTYDVDVRLQYVDEDEPVFIAMVTDVTERNQYEEELKTLAFRDPGTDLYNRRFFLEHLNGTINNANRMHQSLGLILIDMDDFSNVNNTYGHIAGDEIIADFAKKINNVFSRKTDVVARYGGDEFVVMCLDNKEQHLLAKCGQLLELLNQPFDYEGNTIIQTASVGICIRNGADGEITAENLIRGADSAMYEVKHTGKNSFRVCKE